MSRRKQFTLSLIVLLALSSLSCGGGGSSGGGTTWGGTLNDGYDVAEIECTGTVTGGTFTSGTFSTTVAAGKMSTCVNATNPQVTADTSVPTGLDIGTDGSTETNVTTGATAYTLTVGDRGFITDSSGNVTLTIPYVATTIPGANEDPLHVFVRILNNDDNSVVDVMGTVDTVAKTVTVNLTGLPASMTAVVIYNPNMAAIASSTTANTAVSVTKATPTTWGAARWCAIYDAGNTSLQAAYTTYKGSNPTATLADMMKAVAANNAVISQNYFVAAGFRQPALHVKSTAVEPCSALTTTPHFNIHVRVGGSQFSPVVSGEPVAPNGNHWGRVYVGTARLNLTTSDGLGPVLASIAHEILHAIQYGYDIPFASTTIGYAEGTATTYGRSIGVNSGTTSNMPYARQQSNEIFKLDHYIGQNSADATTFVSTIGYSNQDFFAYVGRKYNSNNLSYLNALFDQMKSDIAAETSDPLQFQPTRKLMRDAMDIYFQANFTGAPTLKEVYLDFVKQRAMEHNTESQLHTGDPTIAGVFVSTVFNTAGIAAFSIDPLNVTTTSGSFTNTAPFATRAIQITPSQTVAAGGTGATISVRLIPTNGSIGTTFDGIAYQNGNRQTLQETNSFTNFGMSSTDEIILLVSNVSDTKNDLEVIVGGDNGSGDSGGTGDTSFFSLTTNTLPGQSMTPGWMTVVDSTTGFIIIQVTVTGGPTSTSPILALFLNTSRITGAGTYTTITNDVTSADAQLSYTQVSPSVGYFPTGSGATLTITEWGTASGDTIKGSFSVPMVDATDPTQTGTLTATFVAVIPTIGNL
ncbi:MAG: hypothetical protein ABIE74_03930 [Pseudomonadota bacterium]